MSDAASAAETAPLSISAAAARRLAKVLAADPGAALRVSVKGGGCSGFQYAFEIDATRADDDFVDDLMGQAFRVVNPNAKTSCGCGVSFSL